MRLEQRLKKECKPFLTEYNQLRTNAEKLSPTVLKHFNKYIQTVVNPALPEGYEAKNAHQAIFSNGKFIIFTTYYKTPSGPSYEKLPIEPILLKLFDDYKKNAPWVERIERAFYRNQ